MRKPNQNRKNQTAEKFISGSEEGEKRTLPWERGLNRKYDSETGKTVNIRLPEHYAQCLQYLAEQANRSQHGQLIHLITTAIDEQITNGSD